MIDLKCKNCRKVLAKVNSIDGAIKCHRCYMIFEYRVASNIHLMNTEDPAKTKAVLQKS